MDRPADLLEYARKNAPTGVVEREHRRSWSVYDPELESWSYICKECGDVFESSAEFGGHCAKGHRRSRPRFKAESAPQLASARWGGREAAGR